jgi:hypothetical protein
MRFEGRTERRVTKAVAVKLLIPEESLLADHAMTLNVSPHGARLQTNRKWKPGARPRVARNPREPPVEARVVYCEPLPGGRFSVGLEIRPGVIDWDVEL